MEQIDFVSLYQFDEIYFINELDKSEKSPQREERIQREQSELSGSTRPSTSEVVTKEANKEINYEWLVLGVEADRKSVQAIFAASPFMLSMDNYLFEEAENWPIEQIRDFVRKSPATKMVFLGSNFAFLGLPVEPIVKGSKKYLYFPQALSSLKETDKQTKIVFWNQLKKML